MVKVFYSKKKGENGNDEELMIGWLFIYFWYKMVKVLR